jgi:hypothetical protein
VTPSSVTAPSTFQHANFEVRMLREGQLVQQSLQTCPPPHNPARRVAERNVVERWGEWAALGMMQASVSGRNHRDV